MLSVFRESFGRYVAIAILALIGVTFVFFGIDFTVTRSSFAAKVNGDSIPMVEFERELQLTQNQYQQVYREELTDDTRRQLRRSVIDGMVMREVMVQKAQDAGYFVSDERLAQSIRSVPQFQVGGTFSPDVYRSLLAAEGLTPQAFENQQRQQAVVQEMQNGLISSSFITPIEVRRNIELFYERREVGFAQFTVESFLDQVEIDDEAVVAFHAENADRYLTEEAVSLEFIDLDLMSIAESVEISEDRLREAYDQQTELYATSEERRVSHILIEVEDDDSAAAEAEATEALSRLEAGEDFAAVVTEFSDDAGTRNNGGDLGWISRGVLPGPLEDAVFAMEVGEIEGPVESEFGYHVLRLEETRAGEQQPFESVRDELREDLANDEAYGRFYEQATELATRAFEEGPNLATVASEFDLPLVTVERFTRSNAAEYFSNPAPVVELAFSDELIESGESSDLIELNDNEVVVIRVAAHHAPEPRPFDDVREEIREQLARTEAQALAAEAASAFVDELGSETERAAELAVAHGGIWNERTWIQRGSTNVPTAISALAFSQRKPAAGRPSVLRTSLASGDEAAVVLYAVEPGRPEDLSTEQLEQARQQLSELAAQIEFEAYATEAREDATVRVPDEVLDPDF